MMSIAEKLKQENTLWSLQMISGVNCINDIPNSLNVKGLPR